MAENEIPVEIAQKLLEKTKQDRIQWEPLTFDGESFRCNVEDGFSFEISKLNFVRGESFLLVMRDGSGVEIARTRGKSDALHGQDDVFVLLEELYGRARRLALQVEKKLDRVSQILDRI